MSELINKVKEAVLKRLERKISFNSTEALEDIDKIFNNANKDCIDKIFDNANKDDALTEWLTAKYRSIEAKYPKYSRVEIKLEVMYEVRRKLERIN